MKIQGHGEAHRDLEQVRQNGKKSASSDANNGRASDTAARGQEDTVAVGLAREVAGIATSRTERIEELKQLIAKGEYGPNSREVAGAIDAAISEEVWFEKIQNG